MRTNTVRVKIDDQCDILATVSDSMMMMMVVVVVVVVRPTQPEVPHISYPMGRRNSYW